MDINVALERFNGELCRNESSSIFSADIIYLFYYFLVFVVSEIFNELQSNCASNSIEEVSLLLFRLHLTISRS